MPLEQSIVLAPRSRNYTRPEFQRHYEEFHAPLFHSFAKMAVVRYARNHVIKAIGDDPPFDTISEFGILSEKRAEMTASLRSPEAKRLEEDVQTMLAERGNTFAVTEHLVAGPVRAFEKGPVRKFALLFRHGVAGEHFDHLARTYAEALARSHGLERVTLTLWNRQPAPPIDGMVMLWPKPGTDLARLEPPRSLKLAWRLEVDSHATVWE
jgi:uncharacterized protein (TIGR02118 family)